MVEGREYDEDLEVDSLPQNPITVNSESLVRDEYSEDAEN